MHPGRKYRHPEAAKILLAQFPFHLLDKRNTYMFELCHPQVLLALCTPRQYSLWVDSLLCLQQHEQQAVLFMPQPPPAHVAAAECPWHSMVTVCAQLFMRSA